MQADGVDRRLRVAARGRKIALRPGDPGQVGKRLRHTRLLVRRRVPIGVHTLLENFARLAQTAELVEIPAVQLAGLRERSGAGGAGREQLVGLPQVIEAQRRPGSGAQVRARPAQQAAGAFRSSVQTARVLQTRDGVGQQIAALRAHVTHGTAARKCRLHPLQRRNR